MTPPKGIYPAFFQEMLPHQWEETIDHFQLLCHAYLQFQMKVLFLGHPLYDSRTFHRQQAQHYKRQSST